MASTLGETLGAIAVGTLLSGVLFGMMTVQVYVYWQSHYNDKVWTRGAVAITWLLEFIWTIGTWIYLYRITVTFYGVPEHLSEHHWTLSLSCVMNGLIGAVVQSYFAYRVRILSKSWIVTIISWIGSVVQLSGLVAVAVLGPGRPLTAFATDFRWLVTSVITVDLFVDLLNTSALCYYLRVERSAFSQTNQVLHRLFLWSVQTGLITTVMALLMLIFQLVLPLTELWIGVSLFYGKLYSNSLMANLNGRKALKMGSSELTTSSINPVSHGGVHVQIIRTQDATNRVGLAGLSQPEQNFITEELYISPTTNMNRRETYDSGKNVMLIQ